MAAIATKRLTADEFFDLPEPRNGAKQELVKGEVIEMAAPGIKHGRVQANIAGLLWQHLRGKKIGTAVTESGVQTERDEEEGDTVRGPDVSYFSKERLPLDLDVPKYHDLAPDLCVEIRSPSNTKRELRDKAQEYFEAGVRMVWIVEPEDRSVTVLTPSDPVRTLGEQDEIAGGDVLPGFACRVSEFFE